MLNHYAQSKHLQKGVGLLEVLVAVLVLAIGMMALARFQGGLTRSGSDAKARTVATNLAQEQMERLRTFNTSSDFLEDIINGSNPSVERSGTNFTTTWTVTDYIFPGVGKALTDVLSGASPTVKKVRVDVTWTDPSGSIETVSLESFINSTTPTESAQTLTSNTSSGLGPKVRHTPGALPEIVAVELGDGNTMEATSPVPEITKLSSTNIVSFDSITYDTGDLQVKERESFRTATCVCNLGDKSVGLKPAYFDIKDNIWKEGSETPKIIGTSADDKQPQLCDICCRDHHDSDIVSTNVFDYYDPIRNYNEAQDHEHYSTNGVNFDKAIKKNDSYLESCRFAMVNGIWRVTQDWRQESLQIMPAEFIELVVDGESQGVEAITQYIVEFLKAYVNGIDNSYPAKTPPIDPRVGSDLIAEWVVLPNSETEGTGDGKAEDKNEDLMKNDQSLDLLPTPTKKQLISRAIYIDFMDSKLIAELQENFDLSKVPFYEVNTTLLSIWSSDTNSVNVTNQPIDNAGYNRGEVTANEDGNALVEASMKQSNTGLAVSLAIDPEDNNEIRTDSLRFIVGSGDSDAAFTFALNIKDLGNSGSIKTGLNDPTAIAIKLAGTDCKTTDKKGLERSCTLKDKDATSFDIEVTGYNYLQDRNCPDKKNVKQVVFDNSVTASASGTLAFTLSSSTGSVLDAENLSGKTVFSFADLPDITDTDTLTVDLVFAVGSGLASCP